MFYVECFEDFIGPMIFEKALKLCGELNFLYPNKAKIRSADGDYVR